MSEISKNDESGGKNTMRFQLICAAMLGFGQFCIMTGFDSESFILESVIHSIHEREPEKISSLAGYYGQAVIYLGYMLTCIFSSSIINVTGSKICLILSAICFTSFPIGFLFTNSYYYYFASFVMGIGFALFYQGQGGYLTSHSTRETIESNLSLSWSIGCGCMVVGSFIIGGVTKLTQSSIAIDTEHHMERRFSDSEITLFFTALSAVSIVGIVNFLLIPSRDVENCIESGKSEKTFMEGLKLTLEAMKSTKMMKLVPLFALCGMNISFWISVFPTAMNFSMHNSNMVYATAIYSLGAGLGEITMGLAISFLSKRIKDFGLLPTMFIGSTTLTIYCFLVLLSTPYDAAYQPTHEEPLLFYHSQPLIFVLALLAGITDCCINSVRGVVCTLVMPKRRAQAFAVSKFHQAWASCFLFFLTPYLNIYVYTIGLPILSFIASFLFFKVARGIQSIERRKLTIQQSSLHKI